MTHIIQKNMNNVGYFRKKWYKFLVEQEKRDKVERLRAHLKVWLTFFL